MTDMAIGLGATASCPNCGAQVQVTQVAADVVRCPKCGTEVPTGVRPEVAEDVTIVELTYAFEASGYDTPVETAPDGLRCTACGASRATGEWQVDDLRRGSTQMPGQTPEAALAALTCPSCGALGVLDVDVDAQADVLAALERRLGRAADET